MSGCRPDSCKCFCHVTGDTQDGGCCGKPAAAARCDELHAAQERYDAYNQGFEDGQAHQKQISSSSKTDMGMDVVIGVILPSAVLLLTALYVIAIVQRTG